VPDPFYCPHCLTLIPESPPPGRPQLTAQQKADARKLLKEIGRCEHCGGIHGRACPRLKRIRWDGGKAVEATYWRDGTWPTSDVLFPEDIADDDEDSDG
jgi:hypothetical protein